MDANQIPSEVQFLADQIRLRGFYLSITCDLDFALIMLINECFKSNLKEVKTFYFDKHNKGKDLSDLTMIERLDVCQQGLSKYYPNAYKEHQHNFINIDTLRKVRNKFAHDKIDNYISPNDTTKLTFYKLKKNFKVEMTEYHIPDLYKELLNYRDTMQDTLRLMAKVMGLPEPIFQ